ncbi:hypothetical protein BO82DRAFT_602 [Aspergillus uvarum CBS 121591]|uniref:Uncharacterized protein n=1 Tax=Aspergillus uvarum CBS 121591 TaxID=1448315 RepID=A0A319CP81_9EURO|nr:hypothetical protein BO82DRAFT_602 [Aspergillus uvarum CBS 121591]PYH87014.1 hypothetical protein BO82DRAFT_602 [Aspergillus uvarum CBS 121591]
MNSGICLSCAALDKPPKTAKNRQNSQNKPRRPVAEPFSSSDLISHLLHRHDTGLRSAGIHLFLLCLIGFSLYFCRILPHDRDSNTVRLKDLTILVVTEFTIF